MPWAPSLHLSTQSPPAEELHLLGKSLFNLFPFWEFRLHSEVDSTNAEARRIAMTLGGDVYPRVIIADHQSGGRGRFDRVWVAPPESSLLATILVPQAAIKVRLGMMPLFLACWVMEGLETLGASDVGLKWPNDVLIAGRKVAGILCETSAAGVLMGIGVNLAQESADLPDRPENQPGATSVKIETRDIFPGLLAARLTLMSALLASFENSPQPEYLVRMYRNRCVTLGTSVAYNIARGQVVTGIAEDINDMGELVVRDEYGQSRAVTGLAEIEP